MKKLLTALTFWIITITPSLQAESEPKELAEVPELFRGSINVFPGHKKGTITKIDTVSIGSISANTVVMSGREYKISSIISKDKSFIGLVLEEEAHGAWSLSIKTNVDGESTLFVYFLSLDRDKPAKPVPYNIVLDSKK